MPMNTVTTTPNISQVDRSNPTITTNTKVTNDSSAPFQPQTQVNIESSIKDMLTILSKTVIGKEVPVQEMPVELQKLVNDILQNAFSLDNSLAQGLSNVLQGQKASVDQLNLLSKLLAQLSMELSTNGLNNLSDTLKTFFANTKLLDGQEGAILDSTALNKIALQLLDGKAIENMPEVLQVLLTQTNKSSTIIQSQQSNNMNFLKQLIKQFMPSPQENQAYTNQNYKTFNTSETGINANNNMVNSDANKKNNTILNSNTINSNIQKNNTNQTITNNTTNNTETNSDGTQNNAPIAQEATNIKDNPLSKMVTTDQTTMQASSKEQSSEALMKLQDGNLNIVSQNNSDNSGGTKDLNNSSQNGQNNVANHNSVENGQQNQQNKMSLPIQNTAITMQIIKNLANQMVNTKNLSMEEFGMLKNFVNDKQQVLNESEVKNLQNLLKMSEENLPTIIRQAAIKRNLPDLPKLWSFVQLCDLAQVADLPANKLKNASKNISDFTSLLKESMQNENEVNGNQRSMSFMTPLYLGDNKHCYPTYIHIYNQTDEGRDAYEKQKETWFRICLLTENLGAVEMVFRLYEQSKLNLRVTFSDNEAVQSFNEYMPEIQAAFKEMPLDLTDVKVNVIGE
ncbi:MAG: hypothetical protein H6Q70_1760 [Firmicutes bacterium]|nr:hypothetical protein [Bacillota bacterium]